jgi:hypothetical protein
MKTTLETIIFRIEEMLILDFHGDEAAKEMTGTIKLLKRFLPMERQMIEKAFSDGVGEGLTDPERPFTGKEYYDLRYKKEEI